MSAPDLILHIGAPKCGSSALQTALSQHPDLLDTSGQKYRYVGMVGGGQTRQRSVYGEALTAAAAASPFQYLSWPNFMKGANPDPIFSEMKAVLGAGRANDQTPILSNEGWINHPSLFAEKLKDWGYPKVDVVTFLRPVIDWVNAAYWQWGVWILPNMDAWMRRGGLQYTFTEDLRAWSEIPNVNVQIQGARPDSVKAFREIYGIKGLSGTVSNSSSSAALIGLLTRNREFRKSGHDAVTEFVVQRWCPALSHPAPWIVAARHVHALREINNKVIQDLRNLLSTDAQKALFADPKWLNEGAYHPRILGGPSNLRDITQAQDLCISLQLGCENVARALYHKELPIHSYSEASADLIEWDERSCVYLRRLLDLDRQFRQMAPAEEHITRRWARNIYYRLKRSR